MRKFIEPFECLYRKPKSTEAMNNYHNVSLHSRLEFALKLRCVATLPLRKKRCFRLQERLYELQFGGIFVSFIRAAVTVINSIGIVPRRTHSFEPSSAIMG